MFWAQNCNGSSINFVYSNILGLNWKVTRFKSYMLLIIYIWQANLCECENKMDLGYLVAIDSVLCATARRLPQALLLLTLEVVAKFWTPADRSNHIFTTSHDPSNHWFTTSHDTKLLANLRDVHMWNQPSSWIKHTTENTVERDYSQLIYQLVLLLSSWRTLNLIRCIDSI
jgi:hypothetical protein